MVNVNNTIVAAGLVAVAAASGYQPHKRYTGPGGNTTIQSNLPAARYVATLPAVAFNNRTGSVITGSIIGTSTQGGRGVQFTVNFQGFPSEDQYGPFIYHVHAANITNGNCTTALAHLDPTTRGEVPPCDSTAPESCQAGDLSGKHGNITTSSYSANYTDLYLSTDPTSPYFFGDKSIVVHARNTTRLTCANFVMASANGTSTTNGTSTSGGSGTSGTARPSASSSTSANGAARGLTTGVAGLAAVFGVMAFLL